MWFILAIIFFILFVLMASRRPSKYPPGPPLLPIFGNIFSVWQKLKQLKSPHQVFKQWSREYGDVIGLNLLGKNVVVVSGKEMIKEVANRDEFLGRTKDFIFLMRSFGKPLGIALNDGPGWAHTRKITMKHMRYHGFGTKSMERVIVEECQQSMALLMKSSGKPIQVNELFDIPILNSLWRSVGGIRYEPCDPKLATLRRLVRDWIGESQWSTGILNVLPALRHVAPKLTGYEKLKQTHSIIHDFIEETIEEHKQSIDPSHPRDMVDSFLIDVKNGILSEPEIRLICRDLFEAGLETTSNTSSFLCLYLALNQDVQRRVQKEIDEVIGGTASPSLSDRISMRYTEAVILETLRMSSVVPLAVPHVAMQDASLGPYIIPKGTMVLLQLYGLHKDDKYWEEPEEFRPERILGRAIEEEDILLPFGLGKRRCPGEGQARSMLFLLVTHLLQKFHLRIPEGDPMPSMEPNSGLTLQPNDFRLIFQARV